MNKKHIKLGTISEDFEYSGCKFTESDERCYLYATNEYIPCSMVQPIVWEDMNISDIRDVPDIIERGDKIVTKDVAELIMSFDPYGVEIYPIKLFINAQVLHDRYLLSVKNIIDAIDRKRSRIIKNPRPHRAPVISELAMCPDKLREIPLNRRLVFRDKESNTIFFDDSIVDKFAEGLLAGKYNLCQAIPFDTSEMAPIR